uniref:Uncharacterized protein n=1 Tax=Setaria italica TaxID=4555 RepID=K3ZFT1_SETIT
MAVHVQMVKKGLLQLMQPLFSQQPLASSSSALVSSVWSRQLQELAELSGFQQVHGMAVSHPFA